MRKPTNDPNGAPQKRHPKSKPPCDQCAKIPPGVKPHWSNAVQPTEASRRAVRHYLECRAVGFNVPDVADPLVRQHAALMRAIEDSRRDQEKLVELQLLSRRLELPVVPQRGGR